MTQTASSLDISLTYAAIKLLNDIKNDYQLDPLNEDYLGFVNVGFDSWCYPDTRTTWMFICDNREAFLPIISDMGLVVENGVLDLDETVFELKK